MTLAGPLSVRLSLLCTVLLWLGARSNWNIQFSRVLHLFVSAWTEFLLLLCWPSVYAVFIVRCECFVHALLFDIFDLEGSTVNVCTLVCSLSRVISRERKKWNSGQSISFFRKLERKNNNKIEHSYIRLPETRLSSVLLCRGISCKIAEQKIIMHQCCQVNFFNRKE